MGKGIQRALDDVDLSTTIPLPPDESIPLEPQAFFSDFSTINHPRTGEKVKELTQYQQEVWKAIFTHNKVLCIKGQKIGLSSALLMAAFQLAVLPSTVKQSCRGKQILILAQTVTHAEQHLRDLRKFIINSPKYAPFLITKQGTDELFADEATKTSAIYIRNPDSPHQPTTILALGITNAGTILSWKNVKHVHLSDVSETDGDYAEGIDNAQTRLINTGGSCVLESPPSREPSGKLFDMYQQFNDKPWVDGAFKVFTLPSTLAVEAGLILQKDLDAEKVNLGINYARKYEAVFMAGSGNIFEARMVDLCTQEYPLEMGDGKKVLALDPAFGSSKYAVVGAEKVGDYIYIRYAKQFERPSPTAMTKFVVDLFHRYHYKTALCDSAHTGIVKDLNNGGENRLPCYTEPINFRQELDRMVPVAAQAVNTGKVRIHPSFRELILQLKAVTYNQNNHPDKKRLTFDLGDAFLMCMLQLRDGDGAAGCYQIPDYEPKEEPIKPIASSGSGIRFVGWD
jgi:hypothetical protein